jgi:hypothetical protein
MSVNIHLRASASANLEYVGGETEGWRWHSDSGERQTYASCSMIQALRREASCSRRVVCHGKWISIISRDLILNSLRRPWRCDFDTNMPAIPPISNPSSARPGARVRSVLPPRVTIMSRVTPKSSILRARSQYCARSYLSKELGSGEGVGTTKKTFI